MALDRSEVRRRVKAARMLADYSRPESLARHPAMVRSGLTASRIIQIEAENRDTPPMELAVIAEACGLPVEFFTADGFEPLAARAEPIALAEHDERVDEMARRYEAERRAERGVLNSRMENLERVANANAEALSAIAESVSLLLQRQAAQAVRDFANGAAPDTTLPAPHSADDPPEEATGQH